MDRNIIRVAIILYWKVHVKSTVATYNVMLDSLTTISQHPVGTTYSYTFKLSLHALVEFEGIIYFTDYRNPISSMPNMHDKR